MILGSTQSTAGLGPNSDAVVSEAKLQEDLNRFLNLLVAQLKNQDPLDPLDSNEFTQQLVQFASVEQQIKQNTNLEKLLNLQETSQVSTMVGFIGNTIEATGDTMPLEDGHAEFTYALDSNVDDVTITVRDADGLTVFTAEGDNSVGKHNFVWDGLNNTGDPLPDGAYTVTIGALDRAGELQPVRQTIFGRVTGGAVDNGKASLIMGNIVVPMDDVHLIRETAPKAAPPNEDPPSAAPPSEDPPNENPPPAG